MSRITTHQGVFLAGCATLLLSATSPLHGQYLVAPTSPVSFGGLPGNLFNGDFSGPQFSGAPTVFTNLRYRGQLEPVGQESTFLLQYNLRINDSYDINLCCSGTVDRGQTLDFPFIDEPTDPDFISTPGFFFFEDGDQLSYEGWTTEQFDPIDPRGDPVQARINDLELIYENQVDPTTIVDLGTFGSGDFRFNTVPTIDENNPDAANGDIAGRLAIYSASDFAPVVVGEFPQSLNDPLFKYSEAEATLAPGEYFLALGRDGTRFEPDAVYTLPTQFPGAEGQVFNLELNDEPLITGGELERINNLISRPSLFSFTVADSLDGDFDGDGVVNAADFAVWRDSIGAAEDQGALSGNGDGGVVSVSDYELWLQNFGAGQSWALPTASAVPEPASAAFVALSALGVACLRRR